MWFKYSNGAGTSGATMRGIKMKLNEFGKEMRRLRLDRDELLKDMAARLRVTPAFLSSIETGRKPVPVGFADRVAEEYGLSAEARTLLQTLADATRTSFEIKLERSSTAQHREAAALLARQFPSLNQSDLDRLLSMFKWSGS
jgi:transcriptional regulator with XRE-family HTH domain